MLRKGQIWISAALYTALAVILIGLILSVGLPFVTKIKTRNTLLQTKNVMYDLDELIRSTGKEDFGSSRPVFIEIQEGDFVIDEVKDVISWNVISDDKLGIEPGVEIHEGNLIIESMEIGEGYNIELRLDYGESGVDLKTTPGTEKLEGIHNLVIERASGDKCGG